MKKKAIAVKKITNHDLVQINIMEFITNDKIIKPEDVFEGYKATKSNKKTKEKKTKKKAKTKKY